MKMRGFTLIELVVTMGIMALITTVTLANHSKFGGQVMLRNLAYELALVVREAQTYGVSVRKTSTVTGFDAGYGIHFDPSTPKSYTMFSEFSDTADEDGLYTENDIFVTGYSIGRGYKINKLCVTADTNALCNGTVDILFKRPEPDALIQYTTTSGVTSGPYRKAEIELISPRGDTMSVIIEVSGQISVIKMP